MLTYFLLQFLQLLSSSYLAIICQIVEFPATTSFLMNSAMQSILLDDDSSSLLDDLCEDELALLDYSCANALRKTQSEPLTLLMVQSEGALSPFIPASQPFTLTPTTCPSFFIPSSESSIESSNVQAESAPSLVSNENTHVLRKKRRRKRWKLKKRHHIFWLTLVMFSFRKKAATFYQAWLEKKIFDDTTNRKKSTIATLINHKKENRLWYFQKWTKSVAIWGS